MIKKIIVIISLCAFSLSGLANTNGHSNGSNKGEIIAAGTVGGIFTASVLLAMLTNAYRNHIISGQEYTDNAKDFFNYVNNRANLNDREQQALEAIQTKAKAGELTPKEVDKFFEENPSFKVLLVDTEAPEFISFNDMLKSSSKLREFVNQRQWETIQQKEQGINDDTMGFSSNDLKWLQQLQNKQKLSLPDEEDATVNEVISQFELAARRYVDKQGSELSTLDNHSAAELEEKLASVPTDTSDANPSSVFDVLAEIKRENPLFVKQLVEEFTPEAQIVINTQLKRSENVLLKEIKKSISEAAITKSSRVKDILQTAEEQLDKDDISFSDVINVLVEIKQKSPLAYFTVEDKLPNSMQAIIRHSVDEKMQVNTKPPIEDNDSSVTGVPAESSIPDDSSISGVPPSSVSSIEKASSRVSENEKLQEPNLKSKTEDIPLFEKLNVAKKQAEEDSLGLGVENDLGRLTSELQKVYGGHNFVQQADEILDEFRPVSPDYFRQALKEAFPNSGGIKSFIKESYKIPLPSDSRLSSVESTQRNISLKSNVDASVESGLGNNMVPEIKNAIDSMLKGGKAFQFTQLELQQLKGFRAFLNKEMLSQQVAEQLQDFRDNNTGNDLYQKLSAEFQEKNGFSLDDFIKEYQVQLQSASVPDSVKQTRMAEQQQIKGEEEAKENSGNSDDDDPSDGY